MKTGFDLDGVIIKDRLGLTNITTSWFAIVIFTDWVEFYIDIAQLIRKLIAG